MSAYTGTIVALERLPSSASGNPRYLVTFADGRVARTVVDASVNYGITNPEFAGVPLSVQMDSHGQIVHVTNPNGAFA